MSDAIPPALTPDEWKQGGVDRASVSLSAFAGPRCLVVSDRLGAPVAVPAYDLPGVIALANDVLAPGSKYKITMRDVSNVRALLRHVRIDEERPDARQFLDEAQALIAKLIALLPGGADAA